MDVFLVCDRAAHPPFPRRGEGGRGRQIENHESPIHGVKSSKHGVKSAQQLILVRGVSMMLCAFRHDHALGMTHARRIYFGVSGEPSGRLMNQFTKLQRKYTGIIARGVIAMGVQLA